MRAAEPDNFAFLSPAALLDQTVQADRTLADLLSHTFVYNHRAVNTVNAAVQQSFADFPKLVEQFAVLRQARTILVVLLAENYADNRT
jgi:hypothetical protein